MTKHKILLFILAAVLVLVPSILFGRAVKSLDTIFDLRLFGTALPITDTRDAVEINRPAGIQTIRADEDRAWVTNKLVEGENTVIIATVLTDDGYATSARAVDIVPGSFVLKLDQPAQSNVRVGWVVVNIDE